MLGLVEDPRIGCSDDRGLVDCPVLPRTMSSSTGVEVMSLGNIFFMFRIIYAVLEETWLNGMFVFQVL